MKNKTDYVAEPQAAPAASAGSARVALLSRIKQSMLASRLTFADEPAGGDPYDSGPARKPGAIWEQRRR